MSKRGDAYLRTLLIHGARSVIYRVTQGAEPEHWLAKLIARRNRNIAAVALTNKTARVVWALIYHHREFRTDFASVRASARLGNIVHHRNQITRFTPTIAGAIST